MSDEASILQTVIAEVRAELQRLEPARLAAQIAFEAIDGPISDARVLIIKADESQLQQQLAKLKAIQS